jgi:hypothetical protein
LGTLLSFYLLELCACVIKIKGLALLFIKQYKKNEVFTLGFPTYMDRSHQRACMRTVLPAYLTVGLASKAKLTAQKPSLLQKFKLS